MGKSGNPVTTMSTHRVDWLNLAFVGLSHLVAGLAVVYLAAVHFSWWTLGLGLLYYLLCGMSITAGYHRLFAHPTYRARGIVKVIFLLFGAASVQNSALRWAADHRRHHSRVDTEDDPYSIRRGFLWAHIGWVLLRSENRGRTAVVRDLDNDALVRLQHRFYVPLALLVGVAIPAALGTLWGDPLGAVLVAGFLRLVIQWHATFSINSICHKFGTRPFSRESSGRDSFVNALITFGEGYHNFHHRFTRDYRNGVRWYQFDPTKWIVWMLSKVGLASDLKRVSREAIERARQAVLAESAATRSPVA